MSAGARGPTAVVSTPLGIAAVLLAALASASAAGQSFPAKTVRMVVPSSPGGGTDFTARVLSVKLAERFGQQVVVDNRPGAGTVLGNDVVAKSAPDGYTLLMAASALVISPAVQRKLPYDVVRDFAPISQAVSVPNVLVVHPSLPVRSLPEFIAFAKRQPGKLTAGSAGTGTRPHLSLALFETLSGTSILHVPYKGSGQGLIGLLGGEVALMFPSVPTAAPQIAVGRLRALGVTTARRSIGLPDVPTLAEAGLPGYEATQWFGLLAPAGTPSSAIDMVHKATVEALKLADVSRQLMTEGAEPVGTSPQEFARYIKEELAKWAAVVKAAGLASP